MTDGPRLDGALSHLVRAVSQAAQLASRMRRRRLVAIDKADRTRLTMADLAVQALITHALEQACPGEALVAEEDASSLVTDVGRALVPPLLRALQPLLPGVTASELARLLDRGGGPPASRSWVLDPIDGTEGFLRSGGHYVVALARLDEGEPGLGVLGCPTLDAGGFPEPPSALHGSLLVAQRGHRAWLSPLAIGDFKRVAASDSTTLRSARGLASFVESHVDVAASAAFERAAALDAPPVRVDGQARHALIACGHGDFFVRIPADPAYREAIWDHAAGALAIEEAGGRITDLDGHALDFAAGRRLIRNRGIVASNGHLHDAILGALGQRRSAN